MTRAFLAVLALAGFAMTQAVSQPATTQTVLSFDDLDRWADDDHQVALDVFRGTCGDLKDPEWRSVCALARSEPKARVFFELFFRPVLVEDGQPGLFTGYFEPELNGSKYRTARFRVPLYRKPPELNDGQLWHTRAAIETQGLMANRGLEIAWVDDPVEVFFLQVQGSGRIRMQDGTTIRVGYGGSNGHSYKSVGEEMVRRGIYQPHQVSAEVIKNWVRRNPGDGASLLRVNPSYVFFRTIPELTADKGPRGAMNRSITPHRTIAADPVFVPLGAPVWVEKGGAGSFKRLMVAQDTGSAIKGAQRADIFFGTGADAGRAAGRLRDPGRMIVLMPIEMAYARAEGIGQ